MTSTGDREAGLDKMRLQALLRLSTREFLNFEEFLDASLLAASELLESPYGYFAVYTDERSAMRHIAFTPPVKEDCGIARGGDALSMGMAGFWRSAGKRRTHLIINEFANLRALTSGLPERHVGIFRLLSVPILSEGQIVAVLTLANKQDGYTEVDVRQLTLMMEILWEIGSRKKAEADLLRSREEILRLNRELETKIKERTEELRVLSRRLIDVQEEERRHIARELHDEIGQALTAIKFAVEHLTDDLPPSRRDEGWGVVASVGELLQMVRRLSLDLRPSILDDFGLVPALKWHFGRVATNTGLRISFDCEGLAWRFGRLREIALYRIAQEALANVVHHASTKEAWVKLTISENSARLEVTDRGAGFVIESWSLTQDSTGLSGMRERATLLGGSFSIDTRPGQGTRITASLPLQKPRALSGTWEAEA